MTGKQKETMYQQIEKHGNNLNAIFHTGIDSVTLCKKLKRIETSANRQAVDYCNGDITTDQWPEHKKAILARVDRVLGFLALNIPVKVNPDARGYTLKIDDKYIRDNDIQIHTDMGGYGILVPDYSV